MTHRSLDVGALTRVEGEGALAVRVRDGAVESVELRIYEPPRLFEAILRGRGCEEAPDITARICGICPAAYQMSACLAIEQACGVTVDGPLRDLRRLLYFGEWIQSHALHVHLLHAPDYLGYPDAVAMAADHRDAVERGLRLKKIGNRIMETIGGRAIHPVNVRLGGFWRAPSRAEVSALAEPLRDAVDDALAATVWVAGFEFPDLEVPYEFLALQRPDEYAVLGGRVVSSTGLDLDVREFDDHVTEEHVERSTALHARVDGRPYLTGPLARYALNGARLSPLARDAAERAALPTVVRNPFRSIVVRCVEIVHACEEALRLIDTYEPPPVSAIEVPPAAGVGHGATEAPRGILYHRYRLAADGTIVDARIVPPTAQNQGQIERDLRDLVAANLDLTDAELTHRCEQAIRAYDPCISCATHFLDLRIDRR